MKKQYKVMQLQYYIEMISSYDLTSFKNQLEGFKNTIEGLQKQKQYTLGEINLMLGQKFDSPLEIGNISAADKKIPTINYNEALKTAMEKSYSRILKHGKSKDKHGVWSDEYEAAERQFNTAAINFDI